MEFYAGGRFRAWGRHSIDRVATREFREGNGNNYLEVISNEVDLIETAKVKGDIVAMTRNVTWAAFAEQ
jgi:hypothetical protein